MISLLEQKKGSSVQLCTRKKDGKQVVAKIYTKKEMITRDIVRLLNEGTIMTLLRGVKGQAQLISYVEDDGYYFIVVDYYPCGDMLHFFDANDIIPVEVALLICKKIAYALHEFHSFGYAHRDIKLENVFLDADLNPYLGDFGYACPNQRTRHPESIGSPAYAAPEILRRQTEEIDLQTTDLFSLGVLFYSFLCGRHPQPGDTDRERLRRDNFIPITKNDNVPSGMKKLIEGLLIINPKERITWSSILREEHYLLDPIVYF